MAKSTWTFNLDANTVKGTVSTKYNKSSKSIDHTVIFEVAGLKVKDVIIDAARQWVIDLRTTLRGMSKEAFEEFLHNDGVVMKMRPEDRNQLPKTLGDRLRYQIAIAANMLAEAVDPDEKEVLDRILARKRARLEEYLNPPPAEMVEDTDDEDEENEDEESDNVLEVA